jgi:hypothetical protein
MLWFFFPLLDPVLVDCNNFVDLITYRVKNIINIDNINKITKEISIEEKRKRNIEKWNNEYENLVLHFKYLAKFRKNTEEYFSIFRWLRYPDGRYPIIVGKNFKVHTFTASLGKYGNSHENLTYEYFHVKDDLENVLFPVCIKYIENQFEITNSESFRRRISLEDQIDQLYKKGLLFSPVSIGKYFETLGIDTELSVKDYMEKNFRSITEPKQIVDHIKNQIDTEMIKDIEEYEKISNVKKIEVTTCIDKGTGVQAQKEKMFFDNIIAIRYTSTETDLGFNMDRVISKLKIINKKLDSIIELYYLPGVGKYGIQTINGDSETIIFSNLFNNKLKLFCELFDLKPNKNKVFKFDRCIDYRSQILNKINKVLHDIDVIDNDTNVDYFNDYYLTLKFDDIYEKIDGLFCSPEVINREYHVHVRDSQSSYELNLNECFDIKSFIKSVFKDRQDNKVEVYTLTNTGYIMVQKNRYGRNDDGIYTIYDAKTKKKETIQVTENTIEQEIDIINNIVKNTWNDNFLTEYSKKGYKVEIIGNKFEIHITLFYDDKEVVIKKLAGNCNYIIKIEMKNGQIGLEYIINNDIKLKIKLKYAERYDVNIKNEKWSYNNYWNHSIEYVNDYQYDSKWAADYLNLINKLLKSYKQLELDADYISIDVIKINRNNFAIPFNTSINYKDKHIMICNFDVNYLNMIIINGNQFNDIIINNNENILIKRFGYIQPRSRGNGTSVIKSSDSNDIKVDKVESYDIINSDGKFDIELNHVIENDNNLKVMSNKLTSRINNYGYKIGISKNSNPCIIKLELLEGSKVAGEGSSKKLRTNICKVVGIFEFTFTKESIKYNLSSHVTFVTALFDKHFEYTLGQTISVDNFNSDLTRVCVPGIHFFLEQKDAINFYGQSHGIDVTVESHQIDGYDDIETYNYANEVENKEKLD